MKFLAYWISMFLISFLDALLFLVFFELSGVESLAEIGYWSLYWLSLAALQPVMSAVALYHALND